MLSQRGFIFSIIVLCGAFLVSPADASQYKIVAIVNDEIITNYDVERYLAPIESQYRRVYEGGVLTQKLKELKETVFDRLIEDKLILHEAKRISYEVDKKDINEQFDAIADRFPSREQFEIYLEKQSQTTKQLKQQIENRIKVQKMVNYHVGRKIDITDEEAHSYYQDHSEDYITEEEYHIRHIFLKSEGLEQMLVQQKANEVFAKIKKGEEFAVLARAYSEGPNALSGGNLGFVKKGQIQKDLEEAVVELKVLETSEPIYTDMGVHFLKLEAKKEMSLKAFAEVETNIRNILYKEKLKQKRKEWIEELKTRSFVEIK